MRRARIHLGFMMVAGLMVAGCSGDSAAPTDEQDAELAAALEGLSQEASTGGDAAAGAAFAGAAMAIRTGIRPTAMAVSVDGDVRRYFGFVHVLDRPDLGIPGPIRAMVAFRADASGPKEILLVTLLADSMDFVHPASARVAPSGISSWHDLVSRKGYLATRGYGVIRRESVGGPCPKIPPDGRVTCTVASFGVTLQGGYQGLVMGQRRQLDPGATVEIGARADGVAGAILRFN